MRVRNPECKKLDQPFQPLVLMVTFLEIEVLFMFLSYLRSPHEGAYWRIRKNQKELEDENRIEHVIHVDHHPTYFLRCLFGILHNFGFISHVYHQTYAEVNVS